MKGMVSDEFDPSEDIEEKQILLKSIKKHVKLLMEEFVNRKFVHEYSSNVVSLCATMESCLLLGLKRRALGLFKESSSVALLEKISKQNSSAKLICSIMAEERGHCCNSLSDTSHFSSNTNSSLSSRSDCSNGSTFINNWSTSSFLGLNSSRLFSSNNQSVENEMTNLHQKYLKKHHWIRLALTENVLDKIIDFLVKNSGRYYNRGSIIGDPCDGYILASLLSGPCSIEYSRVKNPEFISEDPDASELILRQKIHNNCGSTGIEAGKSPKLGHVMSTSSLFWSSGSNQFLNRPILVSRQRTPSGDSDDRNCSSSKSPFSTPRHYVESLHQSTNCTLLFGKNNVYSQPRDDMEKIPGYLSLHMAVNQLMLKWTPNELMNGGSVNKTEEQETSGKIEWDCAMIIWVDKIVYIHCHRHVEKGDTMVLVNKDGSQIPPFDFPKGGHLMSFLSCLENGLLPRCRLDPPLWLHQNRDNICTELDEEDSLKECPKSAGFIAPRNEKKMIFLWSSADTNDSKFSWFHQPFNNKLSIGNRKVLSEPIEQLVYCHKTKSNQKTFDDFLTDLVFRIVRPKQHNSGESYSDIGTDVGDDDSDDPINFGKLSILRHSDQQIVPQWPSKYTVGALQKRFRLKKDDKLGKSSIRRLCSSMKREILARSFYGWLAYCRHMKTIREHLNLLVLKPRGSICNVFDFKEKLSKEVWISLFNDKAQITDHRHVLHRVYHAGCQSSIRTEVWPFLLGVYKWDSTSKERSLCFKRWQKRYELAVSDWMVIETVIDEQSHDSSDCIEPSDDKCVLEIERDSDQRNEDDDNELFQYPNKIKKQRKFIVTRRILNILKQNLNRIEKDVARCDRNFRFFDQTERGEGNLDILQRIMCTWVWENLEFGYIQGMCDLLAPLVVVFQGNEELTFACFCKYMDRMIDNFPVKESNKMDLSFSRMRSAVQILDSDLLDHMQSYGDFTHFYFSYRWFLLDFKREFSYDDVFSVWETIWAADEVSSTNFSLFIGLSLLLSYRDLIIDNTMEFTDIIRFFNEMAEHHNAQKILELARELVDKLQLLLHS